MRNACLPRALSQPRRDRNAFTAVAATAALTAATACSAPSWHAPGGRPPWGSVLGGSGASAAEALVGRATPPCLEFGDRASLIRASAALSAEFARGLGIDLKRTVRSAVVQRRFRSARHEIELVRLEVLDGIYLPVNVYVPRGHGRPAGLVLSPVGCGSSTGSPDPQALAANLAEIGVVVVISEGFCGNGARAALPDSDPRVHYARLLLGLRSDTAVHLQELVSTLSWALQRYRPASAESVGVAGYSYGGQLSLLLAQLDPRVRSVSVPATRIGESCDARPLALSDIDIQDRVSDFLWSAPLEVPVRPRNGGIVMVFPRFLHTTAGSVDRGAPADVIAGAMRYASEIYAVAGLRERVRFKADDGGHHYGPTRREDTYAWFGKTLFRRPNARRAERPYPQQLPRELSVDIAGTRTLADELAWRARAEHQHRFLAGRPTTVAASHARRAAVELFDAEVERFRPEVVWSGEFEGRPMRALRYHGTAYDVPAIEIDGSGRTGTLLYLPQKGVAGETAVLQARARRFEKVIAVDYLGIGELASDRVLLHTLARTLMYAEESLPHANIALLRGVLKTLGSGPVEVEGAGWAASLYAGVLGALEPGLVRRVYVSGVPDDELSRLGAGGRVPDLLLHPALFSRMTAAELVR